MKKRGQAAIFIIIGIILVIATVIVVSVKNDWISSLFSDYSQSATAVPEQIKPLKQYIDSCVSTLTQDAATRISLQGGYINLPSENIPTTPFTPLDKNMEIIQDSGLRSAVWFRESANGIQETNIPTQTSIENEIASYLENNFASCVNNLTEFADKGFKVSAKAVPKAEVKISQNQINSVIDFPMDIEVNNIKFKLNNHGSSVDSNLGLLYTTAKEIMNNENSGFYLENKTLDILVAYDPEVPFTGTDTSCTDKIWLKDDVIKRLKNILYENAAAIKIKNTNYVSNDKTKYMELDLLNSPKKDLSVNLMYIPTWSTVVEINPSEGNILRSESVNRQGGLTSAASTAFFCLNHHRFIYNLKYPVLISLRDSNGLMFQFITEVIIDNNEPRQRKQLPEDISNIVSPICDYPKKPVSIFTAEIDKNGDLAPLTDVILNFKCYPASCELGKSSIGADGETLLDVTVPLCANGVIEATKEGYKQVRKLIYSSNEENIPDKVIVDLEKIYKKPVKILVIDRNTGAVRDPYNTEQIIFQFQNKNSNYQTSYIYPSENNTVELIPGDYEINSYVLRQSSNYKFTIPKQKIENCVDTKSAGLLAYFMKDKVCASAETEPMEVDNILTGGFSGVSIGFKREDLGANTPLNLYVIASNIPGSLDDIQKIQLEIETNKEDKLFREPFIG